ncbi:MAG: universal stress protein [Caldilinea sp.]|nr:universal stress protein [Caldilinea sp.]
MRKHRVLVPNDGSAFCRQIYPHLLKFFPPDETELTLLRVGHAPSGHVPAPPRPAGYDGSSVTFASHRDANLALHPIYASQEWDSAVAEIEGDLAPDVKLLADAGYTVKLEVRFGERGEEIVKFLEHHPVDAIAMTTHWRRGIQKLIFGSVAQYVAAHTNTPIFMVRPEHE